jgi:hypothetical protein
VCHQYKRGMSLWTRFSQHVATLQPHTPSISHAVERIAVEIK